MKGTLAVCSLLLIVSISGCFGGGDDAKDDAPAVESEDLLGSPPVVQVEATPSSGVAPLDVSVLLTFGDDDGDFLAWTLDADGDGEADAYGDVAPSAKGTSNATYVPATVNYTYASEGTYNATATVNDSTTTVVRSFEITVSARPPIDRTFGDTRLFASPPDDEYIEGIVVGGGRVYAGTVSGGLPVVPATNFQEASQIYVWDMNGGLVDTIVVTGEDTQGQHGIAGLSLDGSNRLYAASIEGRVLRFTEGTDGWTQETYFDLPDLPGCGSPGAGTPCAMTEFDGTPLPNDMIWDEAGNLYVADTSQALIWKVPPGPGTPVLWYQHEDLARPFSVNGLRIHPDGDRMVFVTTGPDNAPEGAGDRESRVWTVPFPEPGTAAPSIVYRLASDHCGDGLTYGASGLLYLLSLCGSTLFVIDNDWNAVETIQDPLMEYTASLAFDDERRSLLIVNYAIFTGEVEPGNKNIIDVFVDDTSATMVRPIVP